MSLHRVKFDRSQVGDASGEYVQAADAMDVIETLAQALWDCAYFIENDMPPNGGPEVRKAREALANYRRMKP